jgi:hypothetical protein
MVLIPPDKILWPTWSGNVTESNVSCPLCYNKTTMNICGTLNPEGCCSYRCDCGTVFDVCNKSKKIFIRHKVNYVSNSNKKII